METTTKPSTPVSATGNKISIYLPLFIICLHCAWSRVCFGLQKQYAAGDDSRVLTPGLGNAPHERWSELQQPQQRPDSQRPLAPWDLQQVKGKISIHFTTIHHST